MFTIGRAHAVFTNRKGGVSAPPYATLNLGDHVGDAEAAVRENRLIVEEAIGHDIVWMRQTHSARVERVHAGFTHVTPTADALIMDVDDFTRVGLGVPALGVLVADCVPVLVASADGRFLAAIHAGRAGVSLRIVAETVRALRRLAGMPLALHAAVGPSICGRCYEVPEDMRAHVSREVPLAWATTREGRAALDLRAGVVSQLKGLGVDVSFVSKRCTREDPNLYSYRRDGTTGRFAGLVFP